MRSKIRQLEEQDRELLKLHERNGDLGLEVQNLNEQLEKERTDREKVEGELSDLKQKSATAGKEFPDLAEVYNQFKAENPKAKMTFKEALPLLATAREMMEES